MFLYISELFELQQHTDEEISHAARGTFWELENTSRTLIGKHFSSSLSAGRNHVIIQSTVT